MIMSPCQISSYGVLLFYYLSSPWDTSGCFTCVVRHKALITTTH